MKIETFLQKKKKKKKEKKRKKLKFKELFSRTLS